MKRILTGRLTADAKWNESKLRILVHPLHRRPREDSEEFTGSYVANGGGGRAAMLGPPRDTPPCSPDYALYPLSCPSVSCNAGTSGTPSNCCTPPAVENGPLQSFEWLIHDVRATLSPATMKEIVISFYLLHALKLEQCNRKLKSI